MTQLEGQAALLVGAGHGIGRSIAQTLAQAGADVAVGDIDSATAEEAAAEVRSLRPRSIAVTFDVTQEPSVIDGVRRAADAFGGRLDLVVNLAAAIDTPSPVWEMPKETWDRSLAVDLSGTFLVCREALRSMIQRRRGKIVNVSSIAGKMAYGLRASYAVAKAGVIRLTECMALEAGPYGIQVNAICPGPTVGERIRQVIAKRAEVTGQNVEEIEAEYRGKTVLGEFVRPDDIAALVLHLASPAGDRITGQAIDIDAGYLLR